MMAWKNNNDKHVTTTTRKRIFTRDQGTCQHCGTTTPPFDVDHIDNTRGIGYDEDYNLQLLCRTCHNTKTQSEAAAARARKQAKLKRPQRPHPGLIR
ncbi:HNH endonuclease [Corynebacterium belfantii]|uniref:HNH endonuclease n=1 Tax=Corynebacterium belfantii TaxID=2014537 RepID=A0ABS0LDH9_9CORY|nr:HNH endonuclease [Corynebacterium belfantii]MBG9349197.1 HNH endonuclease [Corynebacterium belfantii]MBG9354343.1 HNH endonuclease [Corynebacterium belfantii]